MKKFTQISKNKMNEANLPDNYQDMSKEELIKLMKGNTNQTEIQTQTTDNILPGVSQVDGKPVPSIDPNFSKMRQDFENKNPTEIKQDFEDQKSTEVKENNISKFISKLLESREMAQVYHWTAKGDEGSHAAHKALEEYYEEVIDLIDEVVEVYSGQYGLIEGYDIIDTSTSKSKEKINYFEEIVNFVKSERNCINIEDTHLHSLIDDITSLIYKTIYKLKFNK